jgi:hypothetical protein
MSVNVLLIAVLLEPQAEHGPPQPAIEVRLQPVSPVFDSPSDVTLKVIVENRGPSCVPVYMDPTFQPFPVAHRPVTVVKLKIVDHQGTPARLVSQKGDDIRGVRADDLLTLDCGVLYGRNVSLSQPPWQHDLGKGTYRAMATVESSMKSFVRRHPALLEGLIALSGRRRQTVEYMLQDWSRDSDEVAFEVRRH